MNDANILANLYPRKDSIPFEFDLPELINQREYLIDGELRQWEGPMQEVTSPVCLETGISCLRAVIGSHPRLTGKESLEALAAASKAHVPLCNGVQTEYHVTQVGNQQVTLVQKDVQWVYDFAAKKLTPQGTLTPTP
jgi:hypothetical protein